ncbi:MAG: exonuclease SbcCD subunit D [Vallitaleaceae bacterium]|nr:exonuclease SbcCD subunit D [Vallitaleaceae bacterium]
MKFIHTSDWHIGKSIHEVGLLEDQKWALNQFLQILDIEKPDAIVIAGDLYDRAVPSKEAVNILNDVLSDIIMTKKIPVLCVAGNHDSGERLEFTNRILEKNGLYIEGKLKNEIKKIEFQDAHGKVNFFLIPFAYVTEVMALYEDATIKSFDDAFRVILAKIEEKMDMNQRNVVVTHGFIVTDGEAMEVDESVRPISVGTTEYVGVDYFKNFDYTALGHLHKSQKVKWDTTRYCGSLLKYSFSEVNHQKGVTVVELGEKGQVQMRFVPIEPLRNMVRLEGLLEELLKPMTLKINTTTDYVMAVLTDENPIYDAIGQLRAVYPNILRMEYKNRAGTARETELIDLYRKGAKSDVQIFEDFYLDMTNRELGDHRRKIVEELFESILINRGDV